MRLVYRPSARRIVGGVAAGIAERYDLNTTLVRLVFLAAINASELGILLYVLLCLSMPSERTIMRRLRLRSDATLTPSERFGRFVDLASSGTGPRIQVQTAARFAVGVLLLSLTVLLFITNSSASDVLRITPVFALVRTFLSGFGSAMLYIALGVTFLLPSETLGTRLTLIQNQTKQLRLDRSETKALFGVVSGYSALTGIETAFLRVMMILLNFLTLGIAGALYVAQAFVLARSKKGVPEDATGDSIAITVGLTRGPHGLPRPAAMVIGVLLLLLAFVRLATEFRLFFFNEAFADGIAFAAIGLLLASSGVRLSAESTRARLWEIGGALVLLYGVFQLTSGMFSVQLTFNARIQLVFFILGLAIFYLALTSLKGDALRLSLAFVIGCAVVAVVGQVFPDSLRSIFTIVQFYQFFYPLLFAACGIWLLMERVRSHYVLAGSLTARDINGPRTMNPLSQTRPR